MVPENVAGPVYLHVPCSPLNGIKTVELTDGDGKRIVPARFILCVLGSTLGVRTRWVGQDGDGLHLVQFDDGQEGRFSAPERYQWEYGRSTAVPPRSVLEVSLIAWSKRKAG